MKTLNIKNIAIMALAGVALTACNKSDEPNIKNDGEVKSIIATLQGEEARTNSEGKGDKFLAGDMIAICDSETTSTYVTNQGTVNGTASFVHHSGDILKWPWSDELQALYTAFSYNGDSRNGYQETSWGYDLDYDFYLPADQSSIEKLRKADLLVAATICTYSNGWSLNFNFSHMMSKVTIVLNEYTNMDGIDVGSIVPTDAKIYTKTGEDGYLEANSTGFSNDPTHNFEISALVTADSSKGNHKITAIIPPSHYSGLSYSQGDTFLKFKLSGIEYEVAVSDAMCDENFFESGKHYIINLKVNGKMSVMASKVSVSDWEVTETNTLYPHI